jgi:ABC-2 type transport system ATP-binding protein
VNHTSSHALIDLGHVSVRRGRHLALDDVTAAFGIGLHLILGPNGAGKSTLLNTVATVLTPTKGTVRFDGQELQSPNDVRRVRGRIGFVPQHDSLHPEFTLRQFVEYVAILKGIGDRKTIREEVARVVDLVELTHYLDEPVTSLSGGMQRRSMLAQALLGRPRYLIMDEPLTGLDIEQRLAMGSLIAVCARSMCVLVSTHHPDDLATAGPSKSLILRDGVVLRHQDTATLSLPGDAESLTASYARVVTRP